MVPLLDDRVKSNNGFIPLSSVLSVTLNHLLQNSSKVTKVAAYKSQKCGPQLMSERHRRRLLIRGNDDRSEISQNMVEM